MLFWAILEKGATKFLTEYLVRNVVATFSGYNISIRGQISIQSGHNFFKWTVESTIILGFFSENRHLIFVTPKLKIIFQ